MNHFDLNTWRQVAGDVLILLVYFLGPAGMFMLGAATQENTDREVFGFIGMLAIVCEFLSHCISSGAIK